MAIALLASRRSGRLLISNRLEEGAPEGVTGKMPARILDLSNPFMLASTQHPRGRRAEKDEVRPAS